MNVNEKTVLRLYEAYIKSGNRFFEMGDFSGALTCYLKAVKLVKEREEAYLNLALTYLKLGDRAAALKVYEDLVRVRPDLTPLVNERLNMLAPRG